ncbi:hypothetical protein EDC01DRAFT_683207 [Geopyxis carbonaria]|nr:hypothetical protein EDC01DRAFT_683207 [Geopyxis carbonaria]
MAPPILGPASSPISTITPALTPRIAPTTLSKHILLHPCTPSSLLSAWLLLDAGYRVTLVSPSWTLPSAAGGAVAVRNTLYAAMASYPQFGVTLAAPGAAAVIEPEMAFDAVLALVKAKGATTVTGEGDGGEGMDVVVDAAGEGGEVVWDGETRIGGAGGGWEVAVGRAARALELVEERFGDGEVGDDGDEEEQGGVAKGCLMG